MITSIDVSSYALNAPTTADEFKYDYLYMGNILCMQRGFIIAMKRDFEPSIDIPCGEIYDKWVEINKSCFKQVVIQGKEGVKKISEKYDFYKHHCVYTYDHFFQNTLKRTVQYANDYTTGKLCEPLINSLLLLVYDTISPDYCNDYGTFRNRHITTSLTEHHKEISHEFESWLSHTDEPFDITTATDEPKYKLRGIFKFLSDTPEGGNKVMEMYQHIADIYAGTNDGSQMSTDDLNSIGRFFKAYPKCAFLLQI